MRCAKRLISFNVLRMKNVFAFLQRNAIVCKEKKNRNIFTEPHSKLNIMPRYCVRAWRASYSVNLKTKNTKQNAKSYARRRIIDHALHTAAAAAVCTEKWLTLQFSSYFFFSAFSTSRNSTFINFIFIYVGATNCHE